MHHLEKLKEKIRSIPDSGINIEMNGGSFTVQPVFEGASLLGVNVSNLGKYPFLSLDVFVVVLSLLEISPKHKAKKGNAMNYKLGQSELLVNTVEGLVAKVIYGKNSGDIIFRRITPISRILQWANICKNEKGYLELIT